MAGFGVWAVCPGVSYTAAGAGCATFIDNVSTTVKVLTIDGLPVPITVNEADYDNSYVCSPYTHYVSYAREELALLNNRMLERLLSLMLSGMGWMLRQARFNRVVQVNNWLLSTNLYPALSTEQLTAILDYLRQTYPGYTLMYRSLSRETSGELIATLEGMAASSFQAGRSTCCTRIPLTPRPDGWSSATGSCWQSTAILRLARRRSHRKTFPDRGAVQTAVYR